ncbi:MAG: hypothetical protein V4697_00785 [Patescibacteria group bacterium]
MKAYMLAVLATALLAQDAYSQAGPCSEDLCNQKRKKIDAVCHSVGGLVYFELPDGSMCYCKCSCLEGRTLVAVDANASKEIHGIKVGETVLALQKDGTWQKSSVVYSQGTHYSPKPIYYAIYVKLENDTDLLVTPDHLFMTPAKGLVRADRLSPSDKLVDASLKPVSIQAVVAGYYKGAFHHIAVGKWDMQQVNADGHFINTKGVVSADYYLQTFAKRLDTGLSRPQVGSGQYRVMHKDALMGQAAFGLSLLKSKITIAADEFFEPYQPVKVPAGAINFLPPEYETPKAELLEPLDNSVPYEVAEYLVSNYKRSYSDVIYHVDWNDDTVNAYAWREGSTRHVALKGGLLRHRYVQVEGAGLVLAHEIGHHFGGPPQYPGENSWASCEGQADYWGAMVAQRRVWWGPFAIEQIRKGGDQLYNLFAYGLMAGNLFDLPKPKATAGICSHPSAACRLATYRTAITLDDKPACAGDPPPFQPDGK